MCEPAGAVGKEATVTAPTETPVIEGALGTDAGAEALKLNVDIPIAFKFACKDLIPAYIITK